MTGFCFFWGDVIYFLRYGWYVTFSYWLLKDKYGLFAGASVASSFLGPGPNAGKNIEWDWLCNIKCHRATPIWKCLEFAANHVDSFGANCRRHDLTKRNFNLLDVFFQTNASHAASVFPESFSVAADNLVVCRPGGIFFSSICSPTIFSYFGFFKFEQITKNKAAINTFETADETKKSKFLFPYRRQSYNFSNKNVNRPSYFWYSKRYSREISRSLSLIIASEVCFELSGPEVIKCSLSGARASETC